MSFRGQYELAHRFDPAWRHPRHRQTLRREFRAVFLVRRRLGIVDRIMKPKRDLHLGRTSRERAHRVKFDQTFFQVSKIVIMPRTFLVGSDEPTMPRRRVTGCLQLEPQVGPVGQSGARCACRFHHIENAGGICPVSQMPLSEMKKSCLARCMAPACKAGTGISTLNSVVN